MRGWLTLLVVGVGLMLSLPVMAAETVELISKSNQCPGIRPVVTPDGRFTAFVGWSSYYKAVDPDTNLTGVFLRDLLQNTTERVDVSSNEIPANTSCSTDSQSICISDNGRYVAFTSAAGNLVPNDTNNVEDVFVRDLLAGTTELASVPPAGSSGVTGGKQPGMSADGRYVVFRAQDSSCTETVLLRDRTLGKTERISILPNQSPARAFNPSISSDGNIVAFESKYALDQTGAELPEINVFVFDRTTRKFERISKTYNTGSSADGHDPHLSANGRYVLFTSSSSMIVAGDLNNKPDLFVVDRTAKQVELISVSTSRVQADDSPGSERASISRDGQKVVFESLATNLVDGETNTGSNGFLRDRQTHTTRRICSNPDGSPVTNPLLGGGGHYVVYEYRSHPSKTAVDLLDDQSVCIQNLDTGEMELASRSPYWTQGDGDSLSVLISANNQFIVFNSDAANLVPGDTNENMDAFVCDLQTGQIERIDVAANGAQADLGGFAQCVSADGRYIVFTSISKNLLPSPHRHYNDVFVRDRLLKTTERISLSTAGEEANNASRNCSMSADGRYVVFSSDASNLVANDTNQRRDLFLRDRRTNTTERISHSWDNQQANAGSDEPSLSADGRYVLFVSTADNIVTGDTNYQQDVFLYDRQLNQNRRVNVSASGTQANSISHAMGISTDNQYLIFLSNASNLVAGDTNDASDLFRYHLSNGQLERINVATNGTQADRFCSGSFQLLSGDGRYLVFHSTAGNLVPGVADYQYHSYLKDCLTGALQVVSATSQGNAVVGYNPVISPDGRLISFESDTHQLTPDVLYPDGDWLNIYLRTNTVAPVPIPRFSLSDLIQIGWNCFSLPYIPEDGNPLTVLQGMNVPMMSLQYWSRQPSKPGWIGYGPSFGWTGPMEMGSAYWLLNTGNAMGIHYKGLECETDFQLTIPAHLQAPFWIQFGVPFPKPLSCTNLRFTNKAVSSSSKSWQEAYSARMVESKAFGFESYRQQFFTAGSADYYPDSTSLQPWYGYWLLINRPEELTVLFPKP